MGSILKIRLHIGNNFRDGHREPHTVKQRKLGYERK
jgi:hypothetical protein